HVTGVQTCALPIFLAGVETCLLDGQCRADRHLVVVRPDGADAGAAVLGLEHGLHDFLALAARELAGLRADDPRVRVARDDAVEALLTVDGGRRADSAL